MCNLNFLEVLAGKGAEKHLCRVSSTLLPRERFRLVEECVEELCDCHTVRDSFDLHLVFLVWVTVRMLVLKVQAQICIGEPVQSR